MPDHLTEELANLWLCGEGLVGDSYDHSILACEECRRVYHRVILTRLLRDTGKAPDALQVVMVNLHLKTADALSHLPPVGIVCFFRAMARVFHQPTWRALRIARHALGEDFLDRGSLPRPEQD